ncbi:hypothetical protein WUBG_01882 [Wuchereria bancrofti]|uniref:Uncharacterized protein n=1 Tax=Wuchereria bancrofti TaxID=6293 RepID=J9FIP3_WUCBA|nr:hypothetical protein WUBG_01882 [Wuchereria bancrofti]
MSETGSMAKFEVCVAASIEKMNYGAVKDRKDAFIEKQILNMKPRPVTIQRRSQVADLKTAQFVNCVLSVIGGWVREKVQGEFATSPWGCGRSHPFPFLLYSQSL